MVSLASSFTNPSNVCGRARGYQSGAPYSAHGMVLKKLLAIMRLRLSPEASTYPGFKQTCFVYNMFFRLSNKLCLLLTEIHAAM
jgi:hypothetical protein